MESLLYVGFIECTPHYMSLVWTRQSKSLWSIQHLQRECSRHKALSRPVISVRRWSSDKTCVNSTSVYLDSHVEWRYQHSSEPNVTVNLLGGHVWKPFVDAPRFKDFVVCQWHYCSESHTACQNMSYTCRMTHMKRIFPSPSCRWADIAPLEGVTQTQNLKGCMTMKKTNPVLKDCVCVCGGGITQLGV